ncbi:MAG: Rho termination protein [Desulfobacteraceae bacterium 4572_88]|nr:MAG: Rho termination protein [Desulfobacteraceae bacterium 4572_88]
MGSKKKDAKEKSLDKMTAKELRDLAMEIPEVTGIHGMNKAELISEIKKVRGIKDDSGKKKDSSVRDIKKKIKSLKVKREAAVKKADDKMAGIIRQRIIRLKKKTRKAA